VPKKIRKIPLDKLIPDDKNANRGTERGRKALGASLTKFGAMRSITIDKAERIMAGNKTVEEARAQGFTHVLIVPTDKKTLVAVQREDLDLSTAEGRAAALADNRTSELDLDWDADILKDLEGLGVEVEDFWTKDEFDGQLGRATRVVSFLTGDGKTHYRVVVECKDEKSQKALFQRLEKEGLSCQLLVS
jgi:hypothetical protein